MLWPFFSGLVDLCKTPRAKNRIRNCAQIAKTKNPRKKASWQTSPRSSKRGTGARAPCPPNLTCGACACAASRASPSSSYTARRAECTRQAGSPRKPASIPSARCTAASAARGPSRSSTRHGATSGYVIVTTEVPSAPWDTYVPSRARDASIVKQLAAIHRAGVVHWDVFLENVLFRPPCSATIIDFEKSELSTSPRGRLRRTRRGLRAAREHARHRGPHDPRDAARRRAQGAREHARPLRVTF